MKIAIGCDHRGFHLKEKIKSFLLKHNHKVKDVGCWNEESVDYPDYAQYVARSIYQKECERGILICGSGIGMSIVANKFPKIRAALCWNTQLAKLSRQHTDANILVIGEYVDEQIAYQIVDVWLNTEFEGGRHQRRLDKIKAIEDELFKKG